MNDNIMFVYKIFFKGRRFEVIVASLKRWRHTIWWELNVPDSEQNFVNFYGKFGIK